MLGSRNILRGPETDILVVFLRFERWILMYALQLGYESFASTLHS